MSNIPTPEHLEISRGQRKNNLRNGWPQIPNGHNRWSRGLLPMSSTGTSRNGTAISHDIRPDKSICMLRWLFHKAVNWAKLINNWMIFSVLKKKVNWYLDVFFIVFPQNFRGDLSEWGRVCNHKQCVFLRVFKLQVALILPRTTD